MDTHRGVITVYYRGSLDEGPPIQYKNGISRSKVVDGDYLRVASIWGYIEDLGHPPEQIRAIYFKGPSECFGKLRVLGGDDSVRNILKIMRFDKEVELYVDHGPHLEEALAVEVVEANDVVGIGPDMGVGPTLDIVPIGDPIGEIPVEGVEEDQEDEDDPLEVEALAIEGVGVFVQSDGDEDPGSPSGSDPEHIEAVTMAREVMRQCTGRGDGGNGGEEGNVEGEETENEGEGSDNGSTEMDSDSEEDTVENAGSLRGEMDEPDDSQDFVPLDKGEVWYNPNDAIPVFCCGMRFKDKAEFKEAMAKYSILKCWGIKCV